MTSSPSCTNAALGEALGLSHSTVSRMRSGARTGSPRVQMLLADLAGVQLEEVVRAAMAAQKGDTERWSEILDSACTAPAASE